MSYIGNKPATSFETVQKQISTSNSGTTITLDRAVTSVQDILLTIDAVVQSYDNYSVSGTTLTVGGTLNNNRVEILYVGRTMQSVDPTDDSVSASKIKTDAVTTAKVQNDAITVDKLNLISTSSVPSLEAKGDGGSQDGYIQLNCSQNSHGVKLKSPPHSANQSYTLTLPSTAPATDKILQTNSSGVLSFVDAPSGAYGFLGKTTISSSTATVEFTGISASNIRVVFQNVGTDNSSGTNIRVQLGDSSSYRSGADTYKAAHQYNQLDSASGGNEQESSTSMRLVDNIGNTAGGNLGGYLDVFGFSDSSTYMWGNFALAHQRKAGGYYSKRGGCWFNMDFAADRIKFFLSSGGDFTEGEFLLYEYKEA